jgi:hypothetical protein
MVSDAFPGAQLPFARRARETELRSVLSAGRSDRALACECAAPVPSSLRGAPIALPWRHLERRSVNPTQKPKAQLWQNKQQ